MVLKKDDHAGRVTTQNEKDWMVHFVSGAFKVSSTIPSRCLEQHSICLECSTGCAWANIYNNHFFGWSSVFDYAFKIMLGIISLGGLPMQYGRHNARFLSSVGELITCIMSPGKDSKQVLAARSLMRPSRKALSRNASIVFSNIKNQTDCWLRQHQHWTGYPHCKWFKVKIDDLWVIDSKFFDDVCF